MSMPQIVSARSYATHAGQSIVKGVNKVEQQTKGWDMESGKPEYIKAGYRRKYYYDEHQKFKEEYARKLNYEESEIIIAKIRRHFKIIWAKVIRKGWRSGGKCYSNGIIQLGWQTDVGIICHEFSHYLAYQKYRKMKHNKKMYRIMQKLISYCRKHNYWQDEIAKRTAPKSIKPEPTKDEIRITKIEKKKQALIRYEKKLNYYTKLYSNKIKSVRRSIIMLQKNIKPNI